MKTRIIKQEKYEWYESCIKCGKEIKGSSNAMVEGNMKIHQVSKECKNEKDK